jgi:protein TonB
MRRNESTGFIRYAGADVLAVDRRLGLAIVVSILLHGLLYWFFHAEQPHSALQSGQQEHTIEVALTTLPAAPTKPVVPHPPAKPASAPVKPAPTLAKPKPAPPPKQKPPPKPKPVQPIKAPAPPKPKPVQVEPVEQEPVAPRPARKPSKSKAEPIPEFKDDFQQLTTTYSQNTPAAPALESHAKPDTGIHPGAILNINPRIYYPREAIQKGLQGVVIVLIHISPDGHTDGVDLLQSSGYEELDNQVLGAVQHWRFRPPLRGDTPVAGTYKHTVIFGANEEVTNQFATHWRDIKLMPAK